MQGKRDIGPMLNYRRLRPRRALGWVLLAICCLTGCSAPLQGEPLTFVVPPPPAEENLAPANLLVVREADGNLAILNPESGSRTQLTADASPTVLYGQPVWAPTSGQLAWVRSEIQRSTFRGQIMVTDTAGDVQTQAKTPFPPFYMYWNPMGDRLSLLGNWVVEGAPTIALNIIDMDSRDADAERMHLWDTGQPFYYSWAPDGDRLMVHRDMNTVWVGSIEDPKLLTAQAVGFGAPVWLAGSDEVVYGDLRDGVATLVQANLKTATEKILTWYQGSHLALYPNPLGTRLAVVETKDNMTVNAFGPLHMYFLDQDTVEQVTPLPVMAAFWSPDGASLLFWEVDVEGAIGSFSLRVWDEETGIRDLASVMVTPDFLQRYLPFSDQYALSHTLWSADSRMIAFAAYSAAGENEIFVQDVKVGTSPKRVASGDLAFWSRHTATK